jgi:hypothetical protein
MEDEKKEKDDAMEKNWTQKIEQPQHSDKEREKKTKTGGT